MASRKLAHDPDSRQVLDFKKRNRGAMPPHPFDPLNFGLSNPPTPKDLLDLLSNDRQVKTTLRAEKGEREAPKFQPAENWTACCAVTLQTIVYQTGRSMNVSTSACLWCGLTWLHSHTRCEEYVALKSVFADAAPKLSGALSGHLYKQLQDEVVLVLPSSKASQKFYPRIPEWLFERLGATSSDFSIPKGKLGVLAVMACLSRQSDEIVSEDHREAMKETLDHFIESVDVRTRCLRAQMREFGLIDRSWKWNRSAARA